MDSGKVVLGALFGIAIGAALGVLFAPDKGSATRRKISKKGEDIVEGLEDKFNDFVDTITEKFETMKEGITHMVENAEVEVEDIEIEMEATGKKK